MAHQNLTADDIDLEISEFGHSGSNLPAANSSCGGPGCGGPSYNSDFAPNSNSKCNAQANSSCGGPGCGGPSCNSDSN